MSTKTYAKALYIADKCARGRDCHVMFYADKGLRVTMDVERIDWAAHQKSYRGAVVARRIYHELLGFTGEPARENLKNKPMLVKAVSVKQLLDKGKTVWVMLDPNGKLTHTTDPEHVDNCTLIGTYCGAHIDIEDLNDDFHYALESNA